MANTYANTALVAKGIVAGFEYQAPFTASVKNVNKYLGAYSVDMAKSGQSVDVKVPVRYKTTGIGTVDRNFSEQAIYVETKPFALNSWGKAHIRINIDEEAMNLDDVKDDIVIPSKDSVVDSVEAQNSKAILQIGNAVLADSLGADIDDAAAVRTRLRELGVPNTGIMFLAPGVIQDSIVNNTDSFFNPSKEISFGWYKGEYRNAKDMDWAPSELLPIWTAGTAQTSAVGDGTTLLGQVAAIPTINTKVLSVSGVGTDGTITAGTVIQIASVNSVNTATYASTGRIAQFAVAADATVTGGAVTLTLTDKFNDGSDAASASVQNITALPQVGASVTFLGEVGESYKNAIAYHKDAFMVGFGKLAKPAERKFDKISKNGIEGMCVYDYDYNTSTNIYRTDVYSGAAVLRPEFGCRLMQKI